VKYFPLLWCFHLTDVAFLNRLSFLVRQIGFGRILADSYGVFGPKV
jgi:hypothetical protein